MSRSLVVVTLVAVVLGVLVGFLWWGVPTRRIQDELAQVRASADRLSQQMEALQQRERDLSAQLALQKTHLETAERDLKAEREMNSRLHLLVSQGKK